MVGSGRYRHFRTMAVYYYFAEEGVGGDDGVRDWVTMSLVVSVLFPGRADPLSLVPGYDNNNWETFTRFLLDTSGDKQESDNTDSELESSFRGLAGRRHRRKVSNGDFDFIIYVPRGRRERCVTK